ncbi:hypothetical protein [Planktothrix sp. FACHB-1355]|uniref:hypothetical protein n=1 Tax=Planktothrix sp. FACHB-1355 TaxID=2692854 RepID=UPI0032215B90
MPQIGKPLPYSFQPSGDLNESGTLDAVTLTAGMGGLLVAYREIAIVEITIRPIVDSKPAKFLFVQLCSF